MQSHRNHGNARCWPARVLLIPWLFLPGCQQQHAREGVVASSQADRRQRIPFTGWATPSETDAVALLYMGDMLLAERSLGTKDKQTGATTSCKVAVRGRYLEGYRNGKLEWRIRRDCGFLGVQPDLKTALTRNRQLLHFDVRTGRIVRELKGFDGAIRAYAMFLSYLNLGRVDRAVDFTGGTFCEEVREICLSEDGESPHPEPPYPESVVWEVLLGRIWPGFPPAGLAVRGVQCVDDRTCVLSNDTLAFTVQMLDDRWRVVAIERVGESRQAQK